MKEENKKQLDEMFKDYPAVKDEIIASYKDVSAQLFSRMKLLDSTVFDTDFISAWVIELLMSENKELIKEKLGIG